MPNSANLRAPDRKLAAQEPPRRGAGGIEEQEFRDERELTVVALELKQQALSRQARYRFESRVNEARRMRQERRHVVPRTARFHLAQVAVIQQPR